MNTAIDYRELLKKFIWASGSDSGQCQVLYVLESYEADVDIRDPVFSDEEKAELIKLKEEIGREVLGE